MKTGGQTKQSSEWAGTFGREYTARNTFEPSELDALWMRNYGVTRTALNQRLLAPIPRDARILEVGCNVGNQLLLLHGMGYTNLHGVDVQTYALDIAKTRVPAASTREASALNLPFPDKAFDLVFTSGLLIHIAPSDLPKVLGEIHRAAKTWILGSEYYAPNQQEIPYRGQHDLLWKDDFAAQYLRQFDDLRLLQEVRLPYLSGENIDSMFLLERSR